MKKKLNSFQKAAGIFISLCLITGCTATPDSLKSADDSMKIPKHADLSLVDGPDSSERSLDHPGSSYYSKTDIFSLAAKDSLTILPQFKTFQQTSENSGGLASALMVMSYYGDEMDERLLRSFCRSHWDLHKDICMQQLTDIFEAADGYDYSSTLDYGTDTEAINLPLIHAYLKENTPVIVGWSGALGRWQVIIGYDTMGTDTEADDVLIMANPYDTADHNQDGYSVYPALEFMNSFSLENCFPDSERNSRLFLAADKPEKERTTITADELNRTIHTNAPKRLLRETDAFKKTVFYYDSGDYSNSVVTTYMNRYSDIDIILAYPEYQTEDYFLDGTHYRIASGMAGIVLDYDRSYEELVDPMLEASWTDEVPGTKDMSITVSETAAGKRYSLSRPYGDDYQGNWLYKETDILSEKYAMNTDGLIQFEDIGYRHAGSKEFLPTSTSIYEYDVISKIPNSITSLQSSDDMVTVTIKSYDNYYMEDKTYQVPRYSTCFLPENYAFSLTDPNTGSADEEDSQIDPSSQDTSADASWDYDWNYDELNTQNYDEGNLLNCDTADTEESSGSSDYDYETDYMTDDYRYSTEYLPSAFPVTGDITIYMVY